jgi:quercetin dioxygenase-like cupin family protein
MEYKEVSSQQDKESAEKNPAGVKRFGVARLEMNKGSLTHRHRHESECMLIVLHGACRVYLQDRMITLRENEMVHIPPQQEHVAEALADALVLSISAAAQEWDGCGPLLQNDSDQYLWGV